MFCSPHSTIEDREFAEIQVVAKHKSIFGRDRIIGVGVIPLPSISKETDLTVGLRPCIPLSMHCQAILNVLSLRVNDEVAKEFVTLKTQQRECSGSGEE